MKLMKSIAFLFTLSLVHSVYGEVSVNFSPVDTENDGLSAWEQDINLMRIQHRSNFVQLDEDTRRTIEIIQIEKIITTKNYVVFKPEIKKQKRPSRGIACVDDGFRDCSDAASPRPVPNPRYSQDGVLLVPYEGDDDDYYSAVPDYSQEDNGQVDGVDVSGDTLDFNSVDTTAGSNYAAAYQRCVGHNADNIPRCTQQYPNGELASSCFLSHGRGGVDPSTRPECQSIDLTVGQPVADEEEMFEDPGDEGLLAEDPPNDGSRPTETETPSPAAGPRPPSEALYAQCVQRYRRAAPICGSDEIEVDGEKLEGFLRTKAGPTFMMLANMAGQLAPLLSNQQTGQVTTQGMLNACKQAKTIATGLTALNGTWAGSCALMRSQCRSSCDEYYEEAKKYEVSGATDAAAMEQTLDRMGDVRRIRRQCREGGPMTQAVNQGITGGFQSAIMLANSSQCVNQLSQLGPCQGPDALTKPECVSFCAQPENQDSPVCQTQAAVDCSDPAQARSNPICICRSNPSDPACSTLGSLPRVDTGFPTGGSRDFPSSSPGGDAGVSLGGSFGRNGGPAGGPNAQSRNSRNGGARAGLGVTGGTGGPNGGGGAGSGGNFGGPGGPGGAGVAGTGFKTDIMSGARGGALRSNRNRRGGTRRGAARYANQNPNGQVQAQRQFDLKAFLPGGKGYNQYQRRRSLAGMMTVKARDGITGPYGPSLFEKVSRRYRIKEGTMRP